MAIKIKIDPGHGGKDPGASANGLQEKDVVLTIAQKTAEYLTSEYSNVEVTLTRSTDVFYEPSSRAEMANKEGADYFVSIHLNSFNEKSTGFESFRYVNVSAGTMAFQTAIHEEIISFLQPFGIRDRGMKKRNLAVLRETNMPAILTENLFISNPKEAGLLKTAFFLDGLAKAHADGIAKGAKLVKKAAASAPGLFRIHTGIFESDAKAAAAAGQIAELGFQAFSKNGRAWTGTFRSKEAAEAARDLINKNLGLNPQIREEIREEK